MLHKQWGIRSCQIDQLCFLLTHQQMRNSRQAFSTNCHKPPHRSQAQGSQNSWPEAGKSSQHTLEKLLAFTIQICYVMQRI